MVIVRGVDMHIGLDGCRSGRGSGARAMGRNGHACVMTNEQQDDKRPDQAPGITGDAPVRPPGDRVSA
jgi:hypothetical protein